MGKTTELYELVNAIATLLIPIYNLLQYKEKKKILGGVSKNVIARCSEKQCHSPWTTVAFWVILETILISAAQQPLAGIFNMKLGELLNTGANYFGFLFGAPLLVALVCILFRIDFLAQYDLITPAYPLALIVTKISCYVTGCCRGVAWEHGIYNPVSGLTEFPAQLLESAMALVLFLFLLRCKGKMRKGTVFPIYVMVYSATRFFTEFFRCEPKTFLRTLKTYQVLCIAGVLVGLLEYFLVCRYNAYLQKKENTANAANVTQQNTPTENNHF